MYQISRRPSVQMYIDVLHMLMHASVRGRGVCTEVRLVPAVACEPQRLRATGLEGTEGVPRNGGRK